MSIYSSTDSNSTETDSDLCTLTENNKRHKIEFSSLPLSGSNFFTSDKNKDQNSKNKPLLPEAPTKDLMNKPSCRFCVTL